jgi:hypothetical protein
MYQLFLSDDVFGDVEAKAGGPRLGMGPAEWRGRRGTQTRVRDERQDLPH